MDGTVLSPLLVDLYELTMAEAYRRTGLAEVPASFSLFVRALPPTRPYLVAAGLEDALDWLEGLRFGDEELAAVDGLGLFPPEFLDLLAGLRFTGSVRAVPEGTIVFAEEPLLEIDAPLVEAQLAETFLLNQLTLQTNLATTAARCRAAAAGRSVVDFSLRRTHGIDAGMKVARVSRIVGLDGTSNVAGAVRYGLPASGTMAHSFVQAHGDERAALRHFAETFGASSILLVDTYDTARGVERAIEVAEEMRASGVELLGIRIDSGDLAAVSRSARRRLDEAGFGNLQIFASGDLDEFRIHRLVHGEDAPIDGFGVGSSLGASRYAPTLSGVYKLTEIDGRLVRKTSEGKATWPGRKQVWRADDWSHDVLALADEPAPGAEYQPLLEEVVRDGVRRPDPTLDEVHDRFLQQWASLPEALRRVDEDPDQHTVRVSESLRAATDGVDARVVEGARAEEGVL